MDIDFKSLSKRQSKVHSQTANSSSDAGNSNSPTRKSKRNEEKKSVVVKANSTQAKGKIILLLMKRD